MLLLIGRFDRCVLLDFFFCADAFINQQPFKSRQKAFVIRGRRLCGRITLSVCRRTLGNQPFPSATAAPKMRLSQGSLNTGSPLRRGIAAGSLISAAIRLAMYPALPNSRSE
jgi:hypothetical protein